MDALKYASTLRQEELHLQELGISTLTACFVNANRAAKSQPSQPSDFWYFAAQDKKIEFSASVADVFFSLIKDELMPGWSLGIAPLSELRTAKKGDTVPYPRAWVGENVLLLLPKITDDIVHSPLALLDGASGLTSVIDIDTGTAFTINIDSSDRRWVMDAEININL